MEVPRHWRLKKQRYALVGEICPNCAAHLFPPRAVCPVCAERDKQTATRLDSQHVLALGDRVPQVVR